MYSPDVRGHPLSFNRAPLVGVVGKGKNCPQEVAKLARAVGALVGQAGAVLVTGGLGGAMSAASEGCRSEGGFVIGLLPGIEYRTTAELAPADIALDTGMPVHGRNVLLANCVDALVAVPGSHGTLQEMIVAADLEKPVWGVGQHQTVLPGVEYFPAPTHIESRLRELVEQRLVT